MTTEIRVEREVLFVKVEEFIDRTYEGAIPYLTVFESENEDNHSENNNSIDTIACNLGYKSDIDSNPEIRFDISFQNAEFIAKSILAMIEAKRNNR